MVDERRVAGFSPETLAESFVAQVLFLENLDGHVAFNNVVNRLPHFAHSTDGEATLEFVTPSKN
jgi:hypothetical protein